MTAYYNEIDPKAAAWLRELIKGGHIAAGDVDETDIRDVDPARLGRYTQCHFFAGIGGWSHALRLAGWPDDRPVWTGSCPCQPFSAAGRREGVADERHLWPHWHHLISVCRPPIVFGEQVASKDGLGWLDLVCADLEGSGYAVGAADLCAAGIGAPHIRQRLFFGAVRLADANSEFGFHSNKVRGGGKGNIAQGSDKQSWGGGACGRLADADSKDQRGRGIQRSAEGDCAGDGTARERSAGLRSDGGLADADGEQRNEGLQPLPRGSSERPWGDQQSDGLGNADDARSQEHGESRDVCLRQPNGQDQGRQHINAGLDGGPSRQSRPTDGHWRDADWLFCRDGKWRPVEPGTFPLAHGVSARVGRLRGYGNAIVPQVAATFIGSVM